MAYRSTAWLAFAGFALVRRTLCIFYRASGYDLRQALPVVRVVRSPTVVGG